MCGCAGVLGPHGCAEVAGSWVRGCAGVAGAQWVAGVARLTGEKLLCFVVMSSRRSAALARRSSASLSRRTRRVSPVTSMRFGGRFRASTFAPGRAAVSR